MECSQLHTVHRFIRGVELFDPCNLQGAAYAHTPSCFSKLQ
uniref:Uncharacterized protein n=1 Tax=Arundo donax TaxID=35708 RepID=A0A0A8YIG7_ARUDO